MTQPKEGGLDGDEDNLSNVLQANSKEENQNLVVIHVCDESRKLEKKFVCERSLLINKMTYFQKYLQAGSDDEISEEEVDISVHCDILVFDWLMQYIQSKYNPTLEVHNCVSILISSYFLKMTDLVKECILFISQHLNDIIKLPLDLTCLNDDIIKQISNHLNIYKHLLIDNELKIIDKSDKLISRIYKCKIEEMLLKTSNKKQNQLYRCVHCGMLFTKEQRKKLTCYHAPAYINFRGKDIRYHCSEQDWDIAKYILGLKISLFQWNVIFLHLWSLIQKPLYCYRCHEWFNVNSFNHCAYHASDCIHDKTLNLLHYNCCDTIVPSFHPVSQRITGCLSVSHCVFPNDNFNNKENISQLMSNDEIQTILAVTQQYPKITMIPFEMSDKCSIKTDASPSHHHNRHGPHSRVGRAHVNTQKSWVIFYHYMMVPLRLFFFTLYCFVVFSNDYI